MGHSQPVAHHAGVIDKLECAAATVRRLEFEIGVIIKFQSHAEDIVPLLLQKGHSYGAVDPPGHANQDFLLHNKKSA
jgi:hypothetical protein